MTLAGVAVVNSPSAEITAAAVHLRSLRISGPPFSNAFILNGFPDRMEHRIRDSEPRTAEKSPSNDPPAESDSFQLQAPQGA